jgi:putative ABC transport system permease protein
VVDQLLARQFFPTGNPIGAAIPYNKLSLTIVGVVEQARLYDVHKDGRPQLFVRAEDWGYRGLSFVLRTGRDPHGLVPDVRAAIQGVDTRLAITEARTMDEIVGDALRQQRISAVLITCFAMGALLLAAMGLFGVVSGSVTRRRHEFAVRLALGADHGRVLRLVLAEGTRLVATGLLIGVPGLYLAGGLMRGVLVGVSPSDPPTLLAVGLALAVVALVACYLPARRVLGIEPGQSLRQE